MCRVREFERGEGRRRRSSLKIESVGLELKKASSGGVEEAEWVSLVLMPRIDGSPVVVNGSEVAPDIPIFITLHRVTSTKRREALILFRSRRDRVEGWLDGLTFEVHFGQHCLLSGIFRRRCKTNLTKGNGNGNGGWKMECKWVGHPEIGSLLGIRETVLCVGLDWDGSSVLIERLVVEDIHVNNHCKRRRGRNKCGSLFHKCLPDIPEVLDEDEEGIDQYDQGWHCNCNCNCDNKKYEDEMEMEDYTWAVDASFWAVCAGLGLGFLLSRTSNKTLCLSKFLPL